MKTNKLTPDNWNTISGLSEEIANKRLIQEGFNELPSQKKGNVLAILFHVLKEPMLLLLLISGLIYLLLGEIKDALMLLSFVFVVIGITFYQERKTERAMEALKNLASPRALVIRGGKEYRIAGREVVREDIMILREGDRIPADAVILSSVNLSVDESLLTGESISVRKSSWDGKEIMTQPGGDDLPFVFSGTLVTQGRGLVKVLLIGSQTQMGKIGKELETIKEEDTLLKKETGKIVRNFAIFGVFLCLIVIVLYGLTRGNWTEGFLAGLTLSMAMLPEEFSVVLLIFLTLGAWRMSKRKVLTRQTASIETLGATTSLCVDKTGTLTLNKMELAGISNVKEYIDLKQSKIQEEKLSEKFHALLEYGILASQKDPFDPIEKEIKTMGENLLKNTEHLHGNWNLIREYPLSKHLLALSHVWESPNKKDYIIAAKGAPEAIADLCHLNKRRKEQIEKQIKHMSEMGLRILGVANASFTKKLLPQNQHDYKFRFLGLLGFIDPIRTTVLPAIADCKTAGINVFMITGDYPGTASFIAREIGLPYPNNYLTGQELEKLTDYQLRGKIKNTDIFARVIPEQKLKIVQALKANGEIVAMTGDGVNDAPALKSANIGIAMGERGTDVAREASDIVLLNDDFSSIVAAIRLGRRIYDNLKKAMAYIFAVHIPIAGMSILPIIFNLPIVLLPAHIAFLELIIDPACSTVFESQTEEADIMTRPPRNLNTHLFDKKSVMLSLIQGLSVLAIIFTIFVFSLSIGLSDAEASTLAFITLVLTNIMLIITNLSWTENVITIIRSKNITLWWVIGITLISLLFVINIPFLRDLFHFSLLKPESYFITIIGGGISIVLFEIIKAVNKFVPIKKGV
jgi:Ca2+-transporting ATPase